MLETIPFAPVGNLPETFQSSGARYLSWPPKVNLKAGPCHHHQPVLVAGTPKFSGHVLIIKKIKRRAVNTFEVQMLPSAQTPPRLIINQINQVLTPNAKKIAPHSITRLRKSTLCTRPFGLPQQKLVQFQAQAAFTV